jgi:hypothetical protein
VHAIAKIDRAGAGAPAKKLTEIRSIGETQLAADLGSGLIAVGEKSFRFKQNSTVDELLCAYSCRRNCCPGKRARRVRKQSRIVLHATHVREVLFDDLTEVNKDGA